MPELNVTVADGLWRALQNFAAAKREPVADIVTQALSDYLQISHSTLYQVSTSSALVEGVYQGAVTVKTLREHGDHGLGTFDHLDGEMIALDGRFFQVRSDGSVRECEDDALTPFAVIHALRAGAGNARVRMPGLPAVVCAFRRPALVGQPLLRIAR